MPADLIGLLDAELAMTLRSIDRTAMIAVYLKTQEARLPQPRRSQALAIAERALKLREAVLSAGIELPELRHFGETQDAEKSEEAQIRDHADAALAFELGESFTMRQIADLALVDGTTIVRWARALGGAVWKKYLEARRQGDSVQFTPDEVRAILEERSSAGGSKTDVDPAPLTIAQIAAMAGVHRITVARWLQAMKGPIGEKYWEGRRQGKPAVFTLEEAQEILRAGGSG